MSSLALWFGGFFVASFLAWVVAEIVVDFYKYRKSRKQMLEIDRLMKSLYGGKKK